VAQVELDRLRRQEQLGRDLAVGSSPPHRGRNAKLCRSQPSAVRCAAAPRARGAELGLRLPRPGRRPQSLETAQCLPEAIARLGASARAMQAAPVGKQRASTLERHRPAIVDRERLDEGRVEVVLEQAAAARRGGSGNRAAGRGRLALERREHTARVAAAALAQVRLDKVRSPRDDRGLSVTRALGEPLGALERRDRLVDPVVAEMQEPNRSVHEPKAGRHLPGLRDLERSQRRGVALLVASARCE
jgi:hypothetical protein